MIICLCHRLSERDIAAQVAAGCHSFEALQDETFVATACGCCLEHAQEAFAAERAALACAQCRNRTLCGEAA
jgi:bacterioferritin-associated ferredoxin